MDRLTIDIILNFVVIGLLIVNIFYIGSAKKTAKANNDQLASVVSRLTVVEKKTADLVVPE